MPEDDRDLQIDNLRREIAKLEWEEKLLRKRDDRLRWEQQMMSMEDSLKARGDSVFSASYGHVPAQQFHHVADETQTNLEKGKTYLIFESSPQRSVEIFLREAHSGRAALFITRSNPRHMMRKYDLEDTRMCWLSSVKGGDQFKSISGLQELSIMVSNQVEENPASIILLDGLEYLIANNDFGIVLRLIQQIRDKISTSDSVFMMPFNRGALEKRQLTLLERECETIG